MAALALLGCGGAPHPRGAASAEAAQAEQGPTGAAEIYGDAPADLIFSADLAGMRGDPTMSKVMAKAHAAAKPDVADLLSKIDKVDVRARGPRESLSLVAVFWGRFPNDPGGFAAFAPGSPHALDEQPKLASGVREYKEQGTHDAHVFLVNDGAWVLTIGAPTEKARARFAASATPLRVPSSDLLHADFQAAFVHTNGPARGPFAKLSHAEVTLKPNMTSVKGLLHFEDEDAATQAEAQVKLVSGLLLAAATSKSKDCAALEKLGIDVQRAGPAVSVEVTGIGDAAAAWDPSTCPKLGGEMRDDGDGEPPTIHERAPDGKPGGHRKKP